MVMPSFGESPARSRILAEVNQFLAEKGLSGRELRDEDRFSELGISSKMLAELLTRLEPEFGISGKPATLTDLYRIQDLINHFIRNSSSDGVNDELDAVRARAARRRNKGRGKS